MRTTMYVIQFVSHEDDAWTDRGAEFELHQRDKAEAHLALERANDEGHEFRLTERTTTEQFIIQFRRPVAPENWLVVADAPEFDTGGAAWNWTYDNPLPYEVRVVRRVTTETVEPWPSLD